MDILQDALDDKVEDGDESPMSVDELMALVVERGGQVEFTDASKQDALLEMTFPQYFPYGRGGPVDPLSKWQWQTLSRTARVNKFRIRGDVVPSRRIRGDVDRCNMWGR